MQLGLEELVEETLVWKLYRDGCCYDVMAGVHKGKFCGKKGNYVSRSKRKTGSKITKPLREAKKKPRGRRSKRLDS